MGERRGVYRVLVGKPDRLKNIYVDRNVILRRIFWKWYVGTWTESIWLRIGTGGGHL